MSDAAALTGELVAAARELGFHRIGVVPVQPTRRMAEFRAWLDAGHHGDMAYLASPEHLAGRADLASLLADARSVVVVALAHGSRDAPVPLGGGPRGTLARYARGDDYHLVMKAKLAALAERAAQLVGRPVGARPCVDSAPVLERDLASRAGIGFTAKNTMIIAPGLGSYILLGELLLDVELDATDDGEAEARCGRCQACLDACPTGAFKGAYLLDARRCISYLTIEHRGVIPRALRAAIGVRIFGCDVCQEVCPFNQGAAERVVADPALEPREPGRGSPDLIALLGLGQNQLRRYVRRSPLRRLSRELLFRNLCIALGNAGDRAALPILRQRLGDHSPLVRGHAAWALGRLGDRTALTAARPSERDPVVLAELDQALADLDQALAELDAG